MKFRYHNGVIFYLAHKFVAAISHRKRLRTEVRSAFLAGRYAEIKTVKNPMNAASKTAQPAADI